MIIDRYNTIIKTDSYDVKIFIAPYWPDDSDLNVFKCWEEDPLFQLVETIFLFPVETRFPELLKSFGCFDSTSEARRAGWDKNIESGFSEIFVKRKSQPWKSKIFYIFKPIIKENKK